MINQIEEMIEILNGTLSDCDKFYEGGNNAAGTRVRKSMQAIKNMAQEVRLHVQETKNNK